MFLLLFRFSYNANNNTDYYVIDTHPVHLMLSCDYFNMSTDIIYTYLVHIPGSHSQFMRRNYA